MNFGNMLLEFSFPKVSTSKGEVFNKEERLNNEKKGSKLGSQANSFEIYDTHG